MVIRILIFCAVLCSCATDKQQTNEVGIFTDTSFIIYKKIITKQDASQCIFSPSCSAYMAEAVSMYGPKGILMGIDRLNRCHPLNARDQKYYTRMETGLLYDPVKK